MTNNTRIGGPVDVLAVLEESARLLWVDAGKDSESNALLVAKAAVAELIESARVAKDEMYHAECSAERMEKFQDAWASLDSALTNIRSAK